uniref:Uncharacterized protein n=1 Tax=Octopus bimaculoides TaxID=37653 RepID=A0A0L8HRE4_OCTBM
MEYESRSRTNCNWSICVSKESFQESLDQIGICPSITTLQKTTFWGLADHRNILFHRNTQDIEANVICDQSKPDLNEVKINEEEKRAEEWVRWWVKKVGKVLNHVMR